MGLVSEHRSLLSQQASSAAAAEGCILVACLVNKSSWPLFPGRHAALRKDTLLAANRMQAGEGYIHSSLFVRIPERHSAPGKDGDDMAVPGYPSASLAHSVMG